MRPIWLTQLPEVDDTSLAARIRLAAVSSGKTAVAVAREAGVTRAALYNWFSGNREPKLALLRKLANVTGIDEGWLLTGHGSPARTGLIGNFAFVAMQTTTGEAPKVAFSWPWLSDQLNLRYETDVVSYRIADDFMAPTLRLGDFVIAVERPYTLAEGGQRPDGIYLIWEGKGSERHLVPRRLKFLARGKVEVSCDNPKAGRTEVLSGPGWTPYIWQVALRIGRV